MKETEKYFWTIFQRPQVRPIIAKRYQDFMGLTLGNFDMTFFSHQRLTF